MKTKGRTMDRKGKLYHKCSCVAWSVILVMVVVASALVKIALLGMRNLYHLMAVLIVLVVLSMLMVFVVFVVGRKGRWRPITRWNTKSGNE